jgi:O-methyltransferase/aklanonic acid methyltransferase
VDRRVRGCQGGCVTTSPVVEHFDGVADVYDQVLPFFASFARQAAAALTVPPGAQVLDLAAGRGALSRELAGRAGRLVAVDAAPRMAELLARDLPDVETHVMDAAALDFPDATFDLVTAGFAVHIMTQPAAAVAEVKRVLRPGGQFAFTIPGRAGGQPDPWDDPFDDLISEYRKYRIAGAGFQGNDADADELLEQAGFTDVRWQTLEVAIPVPDGATYWRFERSHGTGSMIDSLPGDKRTALHDRLVRAVDAAGGTTLRRSAALALARRP